MSLTMVVEHDSESGWLVGAIIKLPGCYMQGVDLQQLAENMREAVRAYLRTSVET